MSIEYFIVDDNSTGRDATTTKNKQIMSIDLRLTLVKPCYTVTIAVALVMLTLNSFTS